MLRDYRASRLPGIIGPRRIWSFSYVDDVAASHIEALERPHAEGEYMLGGENAPQIRLFEAAAAATNRRLPRTIPPSVARAAGALEEMRARISGRAPVLTRATVDILTRDWSMDSSRSLRELNHHITPLEDGVRATLASLE